MTDSYSAIPEDIIRGKIEVGLYTFGDLERLLVEYGANAELVSLSQSLLLLLGSIRSELAGDHNDADVRIRSVIEQLGIITEKWNG